MIKRDTPIDDQPKSDTTRRDILTMSIAVATFGMSMGASMGSAAAAADGFLKLDGVKGESKNKNLQKKDSEKQNLNNGDGKGTKRLPASNKLPK
jgi:hypothetical protein